MIACMDHYPTHGTYGQDIPALNAMAAQSTFLSLSRYVSWHGLRVCQWHACTS